MDEYLTLLAEKEMAYPVSAFFTSVFLRSVLNYYQLYILVKMYSSQHIHLILLCLILSPFITVLLAGFRHHILTIHLLF